MPIPAVGISALEMVQVNVTNMAPFSPAGGLEPNCTGVILFYSSPAYSPGSVLPFAQKTFSITSGQTFSFSTNYSATGGNGDRQVIRPAVNLATTVGTAPACILVTSVETFDASTGATHAVITPPSSPKESIRVFRRASEHRLLADRYQQSPGRNIGGVGVECPVAPVCVPTDERRRRRSPVAAVL